MWWRTGRWWRHGLDDETRAKERGGLLEAFWSLLDSARTYPCDLLASLERSRVTTMSSLSRWNVAKMALSMRVPWAVMPRKRLDISYPDYMYGLYACTKTESARPSLEKRIEQRFSDGNGKDNALVLLSVRTGLDLMLQAMDLPRGSEVICSAVTIKDMVKILLLHGLVPVAVDMHSDTLEPRVDLLKAAITPKTKLIVVAHIFGVIAPLDSLVEVAVAAGVPVVEDCAEAYVGPSYLGHPGVTAVAFSFGTIKTSTALAGSVWVVRDDALRDSMRTRNQELTPRTNVFFLKRLLKYMGVSSLQLPHVWGLAIKTVQTLGLDWEELVTAVSRGFPGPDLIGQLRQRVSVPCLALMEHRFSNYDAVAVARRKKLSEQLAARLVACPGIKIPGLEAKFHSYWLFPVMILDGRTQKVCDAMLKRGYDVTSGTTQLGSVENYVLDPLKVLPTTATEMMALIVYLPLSIDMPEECMVLLAETFTRVMVKHTGEQPGGTVSFAQDVEDKNFDDGDYDEAYLIPASRL